MKRPRTATTPLPHTRPERRRVRFRCTLEFEQQRLPGVCINVSATGLYVRVPADSLGSNAFVGSTVVISFTFRGDETPTRARGEVMWLAADDADVKGQVCVGMGVRVSPTDEAALSRFARFVGEFQYTVVVAGDANDGVAVIEQAVGEKYRVLRCTSADEALTMMGAEEVAVIFACQSLRGMTGVELMAESRRRFPASYTVPILFSGVDTPTRVEELLSTGQLFHYLQEPFNLREISTLMKRAVTAHEMAVENERLSSELHRAISRLQRDPTPIAEHSTGESHFEHFVGTSPELRAAIRKLDCVRKTNVTVHLRGETGTGKELAARAIHFGGASSDGPFVAQNCAGITDTLLQSLLFGHKRGAFTGADRDAPGVFQIADGGTLFLDEVAEMSHGTQAALLRVLQNGEVTPVGASTPVSVNVRIVSATHKDLREQVKFGAFREDLYFRLVVMSVTMPPLRERTSDIPRLAQHLLAKHSRDRPVSPKFEREVLELFERYSWPGNIRELENEIQRLIILGGDRGWLGLDHVSPHILAAAGTLPANTATDVATIPHGTGYDEAVRQIERQLIERALRDANGVISAAARSLKIERSRLSKLRRRLGL